MGELGTLGTALADYDYMSRNPGEFEIFLNKVPVHFYHDGSNRWYWWGAITIKEQNAVNMIIQALNIIGKDFAGMTPETYINMLDLAAIN
jgi:hypothetical protein